MKRSYTRDGRSKREKKVDKKEGILGHIQCEIYITLTEFVTLVLFRPTLVKHRCSTLDRMANSCMQTHPANTVVAVAYFTVATFMCMKVAGIGVCSKGGKMTIRFMVGSISRRGNLGWRDLSGRSMSFVHTPIYAAVVPVVSRDAIALLHHMR